MKKMICEFDALANNHDVKMRLVLHEEEDLHTRHISTVDQGVGKNIHIEHLAKDALGQPSWQRLKKRYYADALQSIGRAILNNQIVTRG